MLRISTFLAVASLILASTAAAQPKSKLAVIPTQFDDSARGQVPDLFDDYLLTSVQNTTDAEVIGQDDISALLGFEEQKDLLDCSDTSCIADIGGALGVDKIVVVKIARLGEDWVATAKIINIRETRVESRVNEIISGDVKTLLRSTPALVAKLFGAAMPSPTSTPAPAPTADPVPSYTPPPSTTTPGPTSSEPERKRDPNAGSGDRFLGGAMMIGGLLAALLGEAVLTASYMEISDEDTFFPMFGSGLLILIAGQVVEGIGTKIWANGTARKMTGNPSVEGAAGAYWLGWTSAIIGWLTGAGAPFLIMEGVYSSDFDDEIGLAIIGGLMAVASGTLLFTAHMTFLIGGFGSSSVKTSSLTPPTPTVMFARTGPNDYTPTYGFAFGF